MSYSSRRADRIREKIPIVDVLVRLGYPLREDFRDRQQQFPCDLHGDTLPSARVYPESNSWHCFGCGKTRDAVSTIMEKLGLSFTEACRKLEKDFDLPPLPVEEDEKEVQKADIQRIIAAQLETAPTFEEERERVFRILDRQTRGKSLSLPNILRLWEFYDKVTWMVEKESLTPEKGRLTMAELRLKIQDAVRAKAEETT